jgi:hypothetical protein
MQYIIVMDLLCHTLRIESSVICLRCKAGATALYGKSLLGKDSKKAYHEFGNVFEFFENLMKDGLPAHDGLPHVMPVII